MSDEGIDDGAVGIEYFLVGNVARIRTTNPVMSPSTKARPKVPYDAMPLASDPTSRGSDGRAKLRRISERPIKPKPKPPMSPWLAKAASKETKREEGRG